MSSRAGPVAGIVEDVGGRAQEGVSADTGDIDLRDEGRAPKEETDAERAVATDEADPRAHRR